MIGIDAHIVIIVARRAGLDVDGYQTRSRIDNQLDAAMMSFLSGAKHSRNPYHYTWEKAMATQARMPNR